MKFKSVSIYLLFYLILFWGILLAFCALIIGGGISLLYVYFKTGMWHLSLDTLLTSIKGSFFAGVFFGVCIWIGAKVGEKKPTDPD